MGTVIIVVIGVALGLLIGYAWGWARATREAEAMRAMLVRRAAGSVISGGRPGDM